MLPLDAGSDAVHAQESSTSMAPEHLSETVIAEAIVHAIRSVPGVLDMGEGLFAKAATYGPGKHIPGVVIHQLTTDSFSVEAHVVLADASFTKIYAETFALDASSRSGTIPILIRFSEQIRTAVTQTLEHLGLPVSTKVDVIIDDIR